MPIPGISQWIGGAPGTVAYPNGINVGIFNELNFVIPEWIPGLISKYGNSSYMLIAEILGRSTVEEQEVTTNTYSHFERGRIFGVGLVSVAVTGVTSGAPITITFQSPNSYNNPQGSQSPFLNMQTIKIRSNGDRKSVV